MKSTRRSADALGRLTGGPVQLGQSSTYTRNNMQNLPALRVTGLLCSHANVPGRSRVCVCHFKPELNWLSCCVKPMPVSLCSFWICIGINKS